MNGDWTSFDPYTVKMMIRYWNPFEKCVVNLLNYGPQNV